ncbi:MAG TPA: FkbM family methyltransferase [Sedimentisphaerales bacterium]|nr:FkbM family methyltransferase [Sedimentisphaerales bacterium]
MKDTVVHKRIGGTEFELDLGEVIDLGLYLGEFEKDLADAIDRFCGPGMIVLDIGANVGAHALHFGRLVGREGRVFAFEPTEYAFDKLLRNSSLNPALNIFCHRIALSDRNRGDQEIDFRSSWRTDGGRRDSRCRVDFGRLDDWCRNHDVVDVDIVKLDVDGNEFSVLKGAERLLRNCSPLLFIEVWGPNFSREEENPFVFLHRFGYRFFTLDMRNEYRSIEEMRNRVSSPNGELLDSSFNAVALKNPERWVQGQ